MRTKATTHSASILLVSLLTFLLLCLHIFEGDKNNFRWIMAIHCIHDQPAESSFPVNASFPKLFWPQPIKLTKSRCEILPVSVYRKWNVIWRWWEIYWARQVCVYKYINISVFRRVVSGCIVDVLPDLLNFNLQRWIHRWWRKRKCLWRKLRVKKWVCLHVCLYVFQVK